MLKPEEFVDLYRETGYKKATSPWYKSVLMAMVAGILIALGGMTAGVASYGLEVTSTYRVISGLLFPFALTMVLCLGVDLFTGNCLISISVLERRVTLPQMVRNLCLVYLGNFLGSLLLAGAVVYCGQLDSSGGKLALYVLKTAVAKCSLDFGPALVMGILCNFLVCLGVMLCLSESTMPGRLLGALVPVSFFIIGGFEHCVANMYYISAGLFALQVPEYAALAAQAGIHTAPLTWGNFLVANLVPVTLGNILSGCGLGAFLWLMYKKLPSLHPVHH